ncbi:TetR/AcrR family transcriptional regulator [Lacticaseibacillus parakribbianus]|uniref:TetR/AcrR family transcriptional regulator n=1 Tax=Lacticaseibacillus parakribbianus TaxID=2970927 RepID=UPI0021CAF09B|nr:TetR/AcrR family transcriptional regulator [Lacticaseibacillus parakribbianus]
MRVNDVGTLFDQSLEASDLTARQKAVLKASLELFAKQGFSRTSTGDIAKAAGVSEGTVYKRFKTKEDILQAILAPFFAEVVPKAAGEFIDHTLVGLPADFATLLTGLLTDRMQFAVRNYQVVKIMMAEALQRPELIEQVKTVFDQAIAERFTPTIVHYQAAGQLVDWPAAQIMRFIAGTLLGDVLTRLLNDTPIAVDQLVSREVEFLMKGLRPE